MHVPLHHQAVTTTFSPSIVVTLTHFPHQPAEPQGDPTAKGQRGIRVRGPGLPGLLHKMGASHGNLGKGCLPLPVGETEAGQTLRTQEVTPPCGSQDVLATPPPTSRESLSQGGELRPDWGWGSEGLALAPGGGNSSL